MANPTGANQLLVKIYDSILNAIGVKVTSSVLPSGAATYAAQTDGTQKTQVTLLPADTLDAGNSTTTPLGAGGVFTGQSVDILHYSQINIGAKSNVAGTFQFQFSTDNTNWDFVSTHTLSAGSIFSVAIPTRGRYFRIVYTNGATPQGYFRLQVALCEVVKGGTVRPISDTLTGGEYTLTTKSLISGQSTGGGGGYINVKVSPSGALSADVSGSTVLPSVASTATLSNVSASASSVTVLAANSSRLGAQGYNESSAVCYLKFGSAASTTSYTIQIPANTAWYLDGSSMIYTGIITAVWSSATGTMRVTELTA